MRNTLRIATFALAIAALMIGALSGPAAALVPPPVELPPPVLPPLEFDWDGDGVGDSSDHFPFDPTEWEDTDLDGIGNNADVDDDDDGVADFGDAFPLDPTETHDHDGDGTGDNADIDDDNDGVWDIVDEFPLDPDEWTDTDGDGTGDNADTDDDDDTQTDEDETACGSDPLDDTSLSDDYDGDGIPDCVDPDDDNDGVLDEADAYPLDPTKWEEPAPEPEDTEGAEEDAVDEPVEIEEDAEPVAPTTTSTTTTTSPSPVLEITVSKPDPGWEQGEPQADTALLANEEPAPEEQDTDESPDTTEPQVAFPEDGSDGDSEVLLFGVGALVLLNVIALAAMAIRGRRRRE